MGDSSIESSGAFGIPKWMIRKGMRYEIDDFIVSPPSNEDGGFFHLRYGRCPSPRPRPSSHDCANQEMAMTVEVRDGDPVITGVCPPNSSDSNSPSATLTLTPGALSSETSPAVTPETNTTRVAPLLVLPFKFGDSKASGKGNTCINDYELREPDVDLSEHEALSNDRFPVEDGLQQISSESKSLSLQNSLTTNEKKQRKISLVERVQQISLEPDSLASENSPSKDKARQRKISLPARVHEIPLESEFLSPESSLTTGEKKQRKISLVERVQQIPLETEPLSSESSPTTNQAGHRQVSFVERFQMIPYTVDQVGNNHNIQRTTPQTSPLVTPQTTPPIQRKPFGGMMEKGNRSGVHSYFFTKPFQGNEQDFSTVSELSSTPDEISLSSASSIRTQQLEDGTNLAQALDPSNKAIMGKRRPRPKPSKLREMNFWAPTSM